MSPLAADPAPPGTRTPTPPVTSVESPVYRLRPGAVMVRVDERRLRIGLVRDRSVELTCPVGHPPERVAAVLTALDGSTDAASVLAGHGMVGQAADDLTEAFAQLEAVGHLLLIDDAPVPPGPGPVHSIHVVGNGALAQRLTGPLGVNGCVLTSSSQPGLGFDPTRPPWTRGGRSPDLVVLADVLVVDPLVSQTLVATGRPHVHVHCRDGRVIVGPTVVPGVTSCLRCADLHRSDRDPAWPTVSAALLGVSSTAPAPAVSAATALLLSEVGAFRGSEALPQTLGATVEISPGEGLWRRVVWPAHPRCSCGAHARTTTGAAPLP